MRLYFQIKDLLVISLCLAILIISGCQHSKNRGTIICIGDSLTTCGGKNGRYTDWLAQWLPSYTIINKGISGDTLAGGRARFDHDVLAYKPDIVVIELGANDFWQMKRPVEQLNNDLEDMVDRAEQAGAAVVIASCFGKRNYKRETQVEYSSDRFCFADSIWRMEENICVKYGCRYVPDMQVDIKPNGIAPYWDDNNHPSKAGNLYVAKRILTELKKTIRANAIK